MARLLRTEPEGVVEALERLIDRQREAEQYLKGLQRSALAGDAAALAAAAEGGVVVARRDGLGPDDLRVLAQAVLGRDGVKASAIGGAAGERVAIVVATGGSPDAGALVKQIGPLIGGSGGGKPDLADGRWPGRRRAGRGPGGGENGARSRRERRPADRHGRWRSTSGHAYRPGRL